MFQRRRRTETAETDPAVVDVPGSKGRPTPSRRAAEEARRQRMKPTMTRKEQAKRAREQRYDARMKQREAMDSGDERYLPARDRGPVRRYIRDFVDARFSVAEFVLPVLVLVLALSFVQAAWAQQAVFLVWSLLILATVLDSVWMLTRLRTSLKAAFPGEKTGGSGYALLRAMQFRRFRLPKPQVARGEKPRVHR